jgi:predicted DCC family thiol-disulfide oxidoreductase YuxK
MPLKPLLSQFAEDARKQREQYPYPVMFYDGVCNMCNGSVQFVLKNDRSHSIRFVSLQSDLALELLRPFGMSNKDMESMLFLHEGKLYTHTEGVMRTAKVMRGVWNVLGSAGLVVPTALRDSLYNILARNRYAWFGKKETCALPTAELRMRSLA